MLRHLSEKFSHAFSEEQRRLGQALADRMAIQDYRIAGDMLSVEIAGDPYCAVVLQISGSVLEMKCECRLATEQQGCHHLWCALLAAERNADLQKAARHSVRSIPAIASYFASSPEVPPRPTPPPTRGTERKPLPADTPSKQPPTTRMPPRGAIVGGGAELSPPLPRPQAWHVAAHFPQVEISYLIDNTASKIARALVVATWWRTGGREPKPLGAAAFDPEVMMDDFHLLDMLAPFRLDPAATPDLAPINKGNLFVVPKEQTVRAVALLAETGRLFWRSGFHDRQWTRLQLDAEFKPWEFQVSFEVSADGSQARVWGTLQRGGQQLPIEQVAFFAAGGIAVTPPWLALCDYADAFSLLLRLSYRNPLPMSLAEADALVRQLLRTTQLSLADLPPQLRYQVRRDIAVAGQLYVRTAQYTFRGREQLHADLSFLYNGIAIPETDEEQVLLNPGEHHIYPRDAGAEEAARNRLRQLGFRHVENAAREEPGWKLAPSLLDQAVRELLAENWLVVAEGKTCRRPVAKTMQFSSGQDWLELKAQVDFGNQQIALPELLKLHRSGAASVLLDDGTRGVLPVEWLVQFTVLTDLGELDGEALKFRRSQAALIDALIKDRENLHSDDGIIALRNRLGSFAGIAPAPPPPDFRGKLRDYQAFGLAWMQSLASLGMGGCLADDMGLGKTVQVLAFLLDRKHCGVRKPSLAIMPKSLIFNWLDEARKFAPDLRVLANTGGGRARSHNELCGFDLVLTTYGTMRMDVEWLRETGFDCCILDESQAIKNADTSTAKAARLLQADFRLVMSGTPIENHVGELFSQFEFLNPGLLGNSGLSRYLNRERDLAAEDLAAVRQALTPYILRRTKEEVAAELPPKSEQIVYCEMTDEQRALYDQMRTYFRAELMKQREKKQPKSKVDILSALLRLRQAACHPGLINEKYLHLPSGKLDLVMNRIHELIAEKHKVLVFSQFTSFLALVRHQLIARSIDYCQLDGSTVDRSGQVEEFQSNPGKFVFLISLKAGGVGLNLTAADYVFLLDPWWNPAAEAQAVDRAYRIGQNRKVFAYRFICRDSVEEKVLALQADKRATAEAVVGANASLIARLTEADLTALFD